MSKLVLALESASPFNLSELDQLNFDDFTLAIEVIKDWRLDRYYTTKAVVLDLSMQLDIGAETAAVDSPV